MAAAQPRRRRNLMGEINVVPYIDVMLVLLIIFMITAPLLAEGIKVELPKAGARPIPPEMLKDSKPIVLTHRRAGPAVPQLQRAKQDEPLDAAAVEAAGGRGFAPRARDRRAGARRLSRGLWRSSWGNDHPAARRRQQGRLRHAAAAEPEASPLSSDAAAPRAVTKGRWRAIALSILLHSAIVAAAVYRLVQLETSSAAGRDAGHRSDGRRRARVEGHRDPAPNRRRPNRSPEPDPANRNLRPWKSRVRRSPIRPRSSARKPSDSRSRRSSRRSSSSRSASRTEGRAGTQGTRRRRSASRRRSRPQQKPPPRRPPRRRRPLTRRRPKRSAPKMPPPRRRPPRKRRGSRARRNFAAALEAEERGNAARNSDEANALACADRRADPAGLDQATLGTAGHLLYCVGHPGSGRRGDSRPRE